jgi:circadian clock protein KaiC
MTGSIDSPLPVERVSTGVPGLDVVLRGGLLRGGLYVVIGAPGTGKTTLANQICFDQVRRGERVVYVTLLAESHSRMFINLQSFTFFDRALIGDVLQYFSGYNELETQGLAGLAQLLTQTVRQERASLIVLDGFDTVKLVADSQLAVKHFVHQLHALSEISRTTIILLLQPPDDQRSPELTMGDGVIELRDQPVGLRQVYDLVVRKFRGSTYLRGQHLFQITDDGMVVYPRSEAILTSAPTAAVVQRERFGFGVARLDEMIEGGLLAGSSTMLLGTPGSGKTLLGLHFLAAGAQAGQHALYFGLFEKPPQLLNKANQVGLSLDTFLNDGTVEIVWQSPREDILDIYAERLLAAVRRRKVQRLFLDGLDGFRLAAYAERLPSFFLALLDELSALGVTTIFTSEMHQLFGPEVEVPVSNISGIVDNIFFLRYVELRSQLRRLISILKSRESAYDTAIREFTISSGGIDVASTFESAESILTGVARPIVHQGGHDVSRVHSTEQEHP